jgi:hypothetical protein
VCAYLSVSSFKVLWGERGVCGIELPPPLLYKLENGGVGVLAVLVKVELFGVDLELEKEAVGDVKAQLSV